jgi:hypothetical protein
MGTSPSGARLSRVSSGPELIALTVHAQPHPLRRVRRREDRAQRQARLGLVDIGADDQPVGVEYWGASRTLPPELLDAFPQLPGETVVIDTRRPAADRA